MGVDGCPEFLSLSEVWSAFGTSDPAVGQSRFADFVLAGLQETFVSPVLHGSEVFARRVAPLLKPHAATRDYPHPHRYAARPSVGSLFDGRSSQEDLDDAAQVAFVEYAYTLNEIGRVVARHPSVVCRWIQRAGRRRRESIPEDDRARNKI